MRRIVLIAVLAGMIALSDHSVAEDECGISLAANHYYDRLDSQARDKTHFSIDLLRSQYRVGDAPWRPAQELCSADRIDLAEGETASLACTTQAACGTYQFLLRIDERHSTGELIESRFIAYPRGAESIEVLRSRTVQLGNLSALFEAPEPGAGPQRRATQALN